MNLWLLGRLGGGRRRGYLAGVENSRLEHFITFQYAGESGRQVEQGSAQAAILLVAAGGDGGVGYLNGGPGRFRGSIMFLELVENLISVESRQFGSVTFRLVVGEKSLTKGEDPGRERFKTVIHTAADMAPVEGGRAGRGALVVPQVGHQERLDRHF